jgi:phosphoribosylaminoimidazole-succinocarboxamide synthase
MFSQGIILADTKFVFGLDEKGEIFLIDEVLTPDSSRFWDVIDYREGFSPPSYDKQILRDYLETAGWNKPPRLPLYLRISLSYTFFMLFPVFL